MLLSDLGIEAYQTFVAALSRRVARKTLLNVLGTLSTMLKSARNWGYICQPLQLSELVIPGGIEKIPQRFFSAEDVKRIIADAPEPFATMFAILGMTGIRAGERLGLKVEDLDFERRLIFIRRSAWRGNLQTTKSKASKGALPMPEPLAPILRRYLETWRPNAMRLLFLNRRGRAFNANKVRTLGCTLFWRGSVFSSADCTLFVTLIRVSCLTWEPTARTPSACYADLFA